jgi:hypothetical protein
MNEKWILSSTKKNGEKLRFLLPTLNISEFEELENPQL